MSESVRIVHAADAHIDSPLRGLERLGDRELASDLRLATRRAFENLITMVLDREVDALVLAGDIYDGNWRDYATGRFFVEQMAILNDAGIPVIMIAGNHDAESVITKSLLLPPNVHVLSTARPETVVFGDRGLAVHGQGFATRAVTENLVVQYPDAVPGMANVGLLHTSVAGYSGHDPYAPCTVSDLQSKGYEYFALGHVHARQVVCSGRTTAAFSGNLQGRHVAETGAKGAQLVTLTPGAEAQLEFVELDVARWEHLEVDVTELADLPTVVDMVTERLRDTSMGAGGRPLVARLTLVGASEAAADLADTQRINQELDIAAQLQRVSLEMIKNRTRVPDAQATVSAAERAAVADIASSQMFDDKEITRLLQRIESETHPALALFGVESADTVAELREQALQSLLAHFEGGSR
ncbi:MAG: DNA repair exonuclease [Actinomycetes bacterium]